MALDFRLYLITDRRTAKVPLVTAVRAALEGGVPAVQLREKDLPIRDLLALAKELREVTRGYKAKLFVNDRVDVAIAVDADGVHLGSESMPVEAVRNLVGTKLLIGVSTHSLEQARDASLGGADFITFGPIHHTPSKAKYGQPVGYEKLLQVVNEVNIPIFALGGVKSGDIVRILDAGCYGTAMISSILGADDIKSSARKHMETTALGVKLACDYCRPRQ